MRCGLFFSRTSSDIFMKFLFFSVLHNAWKKIPNEVQIYKYIYFFEVSGLRSTETKRARNNENFGKPLKFFGQLFNKKLCQLRIQV